MILLVSLAVLLPIAGSVFVGIGSKYYREGSAVAKPNETEEEKQTRTSKYSTGLAMDGRPLSLSDENAVARWRSSSAL